MFSATKRKTSVSRRLGSGETRNDLNNKRFKFTKPPFTYAVDYVQGYSCAVIGCSEVEINGLRYPATRYHVVQHWRNHDHSYIEDLDTSGKVVGGRFLSCEPCSRDSFHEERDSYHHSQCWLRTLVANIAEGVEPQGGEECDSVASKVQWSLMNLFNGNLCSDEPDIQEAIDESRAHIEDEGWTLISLFRFCVKNWRLAMKTPIFSHLGNLLGIAIALGFAPTHWGEMQLNAIKLYRVNNMHRWTSALDIVDALVNALNYFVEACYASWQQGDLSPFLYEKTTSRQLDEGYEELTQIFHDIDTGEYYTKGKKWSSAHSKLIRVRKLYDAAILITPPQTLQRRILADRIAQLRSWGYKLTMDQKTATTRAQPMGLIFFGCPRAGKTRLQEGSMHVIAAIHGLEFNEETVADIIPGDAFDSRATNSTLFIRMNDVGNRPLKYDPSLGVAKFLNMCDNVPWTAVKAGVEEKGMVTPSLIGVVGSTNNETLDIDKLSCNGDSLRRRITRIDVVVKPQYANSYGGRDDFAFACAPEYRTVNGKRFDAFQLITINRAVRNGFAPAEIIDPRSGDLKVLQNLEIDEYYFFLEHLIELHVRDQEKYVKEAREFKLVPCLKCNKISCMCTDGPHYPHTKEITTVPEEDEDCDCASTAEEPMVVESDPDAIPPFVNEAFDKHCEITGKDPYDVAHFLAPEKQGIMDSCLTTVSPYVTKFLFNRLGDTPVLASWSLWGAKTKPIREAAFEILFDHVDKADWTQWWYWVPDSVWSKWSIMKKLSPVLQDVAIRSHIRRHRLISRSCLLGSAVAFWRKSYWTSTSLFTGWACSSTYLLILRGSAYDQITKKRTACQSIARQHRKKYGPAITKMIGAISTLSVGGLTMYGLYTLGRELFGDEAPAKAGSVKTTVTNAKSSPTPAASTATPTPTPAAPKKTDLIFEEQNFMSVSEEELKKRNEAKNVWENNVLETTLQYKNPNMTTSQMLNVVKGNLSALFVQDDKGVYHYQCNVLWLMTDLCVLPSHMVPKTIQRWRFQDNESPRSAGSAIVSPESVLTIRDVDFAFVWCSYRSKTNIIDRLNPDPQKLESMFVYKDPMTYKTIPGTEKLSGSVAPYDSPTDPKRLHWQWPMPTFKGLCGGVYVSTGANPSICGLHYGGTRSSDSPSKDLTIGVSFVPSREDCAQAVKFFHAKKNVLVTADPPASWSPVINGVSQVYETEMTSGSIGDQVSWLMGQESTPDPLDMSQYLKYRDKAFATPMPVENQAVEVGHRKEKAFYKSRVRPTVIAEDVQKLCPDVQYGPPKFGRSMWPKGALPAFNVSPGLPPEHIKWAVEDYLSSFQHMSPFLRELLRPLSWKEALNGIDGARFIDSMNFSTSAGIGFPGGKKAWIKEYINDQGQLERDFVDAVKDRVDYALKALRAGRRVPFIFNATPKDEPTDVNKDKVRLFMVGELACVVIVRMYFTPVCRIIQMTTGLSECAVGINSLSEDWEHTMQHLEKFKLFFDGDHKKYDTRKHPSISGASYRIMIEIAALGHYTGDDLFLMAMIASDLIRPLVNYNGDVVVLDGSTPSGIPVTVIVNSLDNSVYNRCAYKGIYPSAKVGEFRRYVSHINYGDDFINGVSWWRSSFNFVAMQEYLRKYDLEITPGIKSAKPRRFIPWEELVFLQRKSVKLPELDYRVGALNESSIFKSLLSVLHSNVLSPEMAAATNVDGALREWTFHGKKTYDHRYAQLMPILAKHGILHLSRMHGVSYEESLKKLVE